MMTHQTSAASRRAFAVDALPVVTDELGLLDELVALRELRIIELGCGAAKMARDLLQRHPGCHVTGLEVDKIQHGRNLAQPQERLTFVEAGAQSIPFPDATFDLALMLKSLHHVPLPLMAQALDEVARVLRPGGHLYVSEPIYDGAMNEVIRIYNDEGQVRRAAQEAVDAALAGSGRWEAAAERRFAMPVNFRDFNDYEQRMMRPTYADHRLDDAKLARARAAFEFHGGVRGVAFVRPMHVRLLRRLSA